MACLSVISLASLMRGLPTLSPFWGELVRCITMTDVDTHVYALVRAWLRCPGSHHDSGSGVGDEARRLARRVDVRLQSSAKTHTYEIRTGKFESRIKRTDDHPKRNGPDTRTRSVTIYTEPRRPLVCPTVVAAAMHACCSSQSKRLDHNHLLLRADHCPIVTQP